MKSLLSRKFIISFLGLILTFISVWIGKFSVEVAVPIITSILAIYTTVNIAGKVEDDNAKNNGSEGKDNG